jgi:hypothetical protein
MSETYEYFMVYELDDSGERVRLNISENDLQSALHPEQVLVIVKEEIRRIFIWKGAKSPVRKRFISSRVASALQEELVKIAAFHRCKIVSVDQGDEVSEFLRAFRLESMEVTEKLEDMRYIRNIDREKMLDAGILPEPVTAVKKVEKKSESEYFSPALQELEKTSGKKVDVSSVSKPIQKPQPQKAYSKSIQVSGLSEDTKKNIMEKIIKMDVPDNYKRQNLVLGHSLYGAVSKKVSVFGKEVEEIDWEPVKTLPKGMLELDNHKLRVYIDDQKGIVEALEILEKTDLKSTKSSSKAETQENAQAISEVDFNSMKVKDLKKYCTKHNIDVPSNARKSDILKLIENAKKPSKRKQLPKIPKQ